MCVVWSAVCSVTHLHVCCLECDTSTCVLFGVRDTSTCVLFGVCNTSTCVLFGV